MFFYEVEGHMPKLSSFGRGKEFGLKSHLRASCTQPFNLLYRRLLQVLLKGRLVTVVVYHLVGKTGWSKVVVNGKHQNCEWKFPRDVRVSFPQTSPLGRIQTKRSGTSRKGKWNAHFSIGYSGWEVWTTSEDVPFISEIFQSGKPK